MKMSLADGLGSEEVRGVGKALDEGVKEAGVLDDPDGGNSNGQSERRSCRSSCDWDEGAIQRDLASRIFRVEGCP